MLERIRAWSASNRSSHHGVSLETDELRKPAVESGECAVVDPRSATSPDIFADLLPEDADECSSYDAGFFERDEYDSQ